MNLSKMEFQLLKQLKLQPSEMDQMEFYRLEYLIDHLKEHNEEEKKRQEAEEKKQKSESFDMKKMGREFGAFQKVSGASAPKMPNYKL